MYIINFIRGLCMALADSVPGVSGGTIAFILGFYDKFITSLDDLITGNKEKKIESIKFLVKIGIGWGFGFILAVLFLSRVFTSHIYAISSLFIGFIVFAIPIIIKEELQCLKGKYINIIFSLIGIMTVIGITVVNPSNGKSIDNLSIAMIIYVFISAMISICAMVMPGISGSTLLLIFGLYAPIINAIKEILHFNFKYVPIVFVFGMGVITGIVSIIKLVRKALEKFRSQTVYCIIGLMIGSIYAVFMGPTSLEIPQPPMNLSTFSLLFFIIGGAIILGLQQLKSFFDKKGKI